MKESILITGGAGYISSHTTVELINAGFDVVIVDDLSNSSMQSIEGVKQIVDKEFPVVIIDICNKEALTEVFKKYNFNTVIHFAAYKAVGESSIDPLKYYSNNLCSFMNVLTLMNEFNRSNIIFSSSATVYGETDNLPVTEKSERLPASSPYGNTKQICEDIMRDSIYAYKSLTGIALRYFNPIGAHPSSLIGENPSGIPNNLLPYITQTAANIRESLNVFGDDYDTPDGSCLRDFIDVVDLAKAHVAAAKRLISGKNKEKYEVFNVGTGKPTSVLSLIKCFENVNNLKLDYQIISRRTGDIKALWADTTYAEQELGWKSEKTLEQTLQSAWNWEKQNRNLI